MKYWLLVTSAADFRHDRDKMKFKLIGLPSRLKKSVSRMEKGDKVVYYITKEKKFGAISVITGESYEGFNEVWVGSGNIWPTRCPSKQYLVLQDKELIDAVTLIPSLSFVKDKKNWSGYFQGSLRQIPEEDFLLIESQFKKVIKQ